MTTIRTDTKILMAKLKKRVASLKRERLAHEPVWKEIRQNFEPFFGTALDGVVTDPQNKAARPDDSAIINSHPRLCVHRGASGMQGGITNPATQWFGLTVDDARLSEQGNVKDWLDDCTAVMSAAISRSNLYTIYNQIYAHLLCFANSCAIVSPDTETDITATLVDEGAYWFATNSKGRVTTLLRVYAATADQIREDFGDDAVDPAIRTSLDNEQRETYYTVYNLITPNDGSCSADIDKARPFLSLYWREGAPDDRMLALRSFGYNPILAPRWNVIAGAYGFGPGHMALPDAKELQKVEEDILRAAALRVDPPMKAPASMRNEAINAFPGGVTFLSEDALGGADTRGLAPLIEAHQSTEDIRATSADIKSRIDRIFFLDLFAMMLNLTRSTQMTARQVNELAQEKMSLLGPVLTRMDTDLLDPSIDAFFSILYDAGLLPPPPDVLSGAKIGIKYISILHTEQQSVSRLGSMIKLADFMAMIAPAAPDCVDKFDADQAIDEAAKVLNVPARCIRSDKAVAQIRAGRAEAQQQEAAQQQAAMMGPAAKAARDLSETRTGTGSALDTLLGQQQ